MTIWNPTWGLTHASAQELNHLSQNDTPVVLRSYFKCVCVGLLSVLKIPLVLGIKPGAPTSKHVLTAESSHQP